MKKHLVVLTVLLATTAILGGLGQAQQDAQEFAVIHQLGDSGDTALTFPGTITVTVNQLVRLFHAATDAIHPGISISRDEAGTDAAFGIESFILDQGEVVVTEFTPDEAGEFFITHLPHGHPIVGILIVTD